MNFGKQIVRNSFKIYKMSEIKILAIIPARGGSKGIPNKNMREVGGKPLMVWTIEAALKSKFITKTIVSSDSDAILEIAKKNHAQVIKRPSELATDTARTEPVMTHVINELIKKGEVYDYVMLLQPTSPLRTTEDINAAIQMLLKSDATALISVYEAQHHPLKAFTANEKGYLNGLVNNEFPFLPRQELPKAFYPNGAIYLIKTEVFLETNRLFTDKTIAFEMSAEKSIDIDNFEDFVRFENSLLK